MVPVATRHTFAGLGLVTLATVMYEILLTRIFSVTMWYHYAFAAISIAMFGMTLGAVLVFLFPRRFPLENVHQQMCLSSLLFSVSIVASFTLHLFIPLEDISGLSLSGLSALACNYLVISVPFVFGGICVCLALTRFPRQVGRLYAADLAGAGVGCILLVLVLDGTDAPTAVFFVAFLVSLGTIAFLHDCESKTLRRPALTIAVFLFLFSAVHTYLVQSQNPILRIQWVKGERETPPVYEKWNSFSRVQVVGGSEKLRIPYGWGLSPTLPPEPVVYQKEILIDAQAGTWMTGYDGSPEVLEHLKYDVINLSHYLRDNAKVLVVGAGGGRDILSALAFDQEEVVAVEINEDIVEILNLEFGDFTGHLDRDPRVTFVNDEARSYVSRSDGRFDIIQVSFIDTWAATAAGAFVLTENSLYTVEAWTTFLNALNPGGVLSFSRWYVPGNPAEIYRLVNLAATALSVCGVETPQEHMLLATLVTDRAENVDVGTLLVSNTPFSAEDIATFERVADRMEFDVMLSPKRQDDEVLSQILAENDSREFVDSYPLDLSAPTDDSPFFFNMIRFQDLLASGVYEEQGENRHNLKAVLVLAGLLLISLVLTFAFIVVPLILTADKSVLSGATPLFVLFAAIGFGFMLVEISQMQRLIVFLGHPTYGLTVVLFSLLLSSGLGSYLTGLFPENRRAGFLAFFLLLVALGVFGAQTTDVIASFRHSETPVRIAVATGILFCLGLFMGMPFPIGMRVASLRSHNLTPWLWGVNGATSVCASVIAVAISLMWGISTTYWVGVLCYLAGALAFIGASVKGTGSCQAGYKHSP